MRQTRTLLAFVVLLSLLSAYAGAAGVRESIEVVRNPVSIQINGQQLPAETFEYQSATYAPIQEIAEALGGKVTLNQATNTLSISKDPGSTRYCWISSRRARAATPRSLSPWIGSISRW